MKELLSIISSRDNNLENESSVFIQSLQEYSSLNYVEDNQTYVIKEGTRFRPVHLSELEAKLRQREFNQYPFKVVDSNGLVYLYPYDPDEIITDESIQEKGVLVVDTEEGVKEMEAALSSYKSEIEYYINMKGNNYNFFNTSTKEIDILNGATTIDVLRVGSDSYTNIISLSNLKNLFINSGVEAKVDLGIQYTRVINSTPKVYNHHMVFQAFEYENGVGVIETISNDFIQQVDDKVQIEYIDDTIKVYSISDDILECVINNCTVTYGGLG